MQRQACRLLTREHPFNFPLTLPQFHAQHLTVGHRHFQESSLSLTQLPTLKQPAHVSDGGGWSTAVFFLTPASGRFSSVSIKTPAPEWDLGARVGTIPFHLLSLSLLDAPRRLGHLNTQSSSCDLLQLFYQCPLVLQSSSSSRALWHLSFLLCLST